MKLVLIFTPVVMTRCYTIIHIRNLIQHIVHITPNMEPRLPFIIFLQMITDYTYTVYVA